MNNWIWIVIIAILFATALTLVIVFAKKQEQFVIDIDSNGNICTSTSKDPACVSAGGPTDIFETPDKFPDCEAMKADPKIPCGTYTRHTQCFDRMGNPLPASRCPKNIPSTTCVKECANTGDWDIEVGPCIGDCGGNGVRHVTATCPKGKNCGPRPDTSDRPCKTDPCQWSVNYGKCVNVSGEACDAIGGPNNGNQAVILKCNGDENPHGYSKCDPSKRPTATPKPCDLPQCFWDVDKWVKKPMASSDKCAAINGVCEDATFCRTHGGIVSKVRGLCSGKNEGCCIPP